jgi:predicted membrane protein
VSLSSVSFFSLGRSIFLSMPIYIYIFFFLMKCCSTGKNDFQKISREPFIPLTPEEETEVKQAFFPNNRYICSIFPFDCIIDIAVITLCCSFL